MKNRLSLIEFLKTYTAISNKFIDEYFAFYELCQKDKFGINLDLVLEYLQIVKRNRFHERFRENYKLDVDYIIITSKSKKEKNKKNSFYYISFDTFEKICMRSKSKKADAVRDYFIILRKFIDYYKNNISEMILQKAHDNPGKCMYIILVNKNKNIFKIGRSENLRKRLKVYATGKDTHPDIKYILLVDDPVSVEHCIKGFLQRFEHKPGQEIYKLDIDTIKEIFADCGGIDTKLDEQLNKKSNKDKDVYIMYENKNT